MTPDPTPYWQTPAVRHLAWLCQAPPLLTGPGLFRPAERLPADWRQRLAALDRAPAPLLAWLGRAASKRLGHYFECLYAFFLEELLGWPVLLHNQPVRDARGRTLGELDFIVRNRDTGAAEHHELAVKYYLGCPEPEGVRWYGPDARDRLDLKRERMLHHQARMTERPETQELLAQRNIQGPLAARIVMPGNLFYPPAPELSPPQYVNPAHEGGYWLRLPELAGWDTGNWVALVKPDWLGPYQCRQAPDPGASGAQLEWVARNGRPALFAAMAPRTDGQGYQESARYFVVPEDWPGAEARSRP